MNFTYGLFPFSEIRLCYIRFVIKAGWFLRSATMKSDTKRQRIPVFLTVFAFIILLLTYFTAVTAFAKDSGANQQFGFFMGWRSTWVIGISHHQSSVRGPWESGEAHLMPPTADVGKRIQSIPIQVAGHRRLIHYRAWGDPNNPAVFVLHGSLSDCRGYPGLSELANDGFYIVIWDQRGNGLSGCISEIEIPGAGHHLIVEDLQAVLGALHTFFTAL